MKSRLRCLNLEFDRESWFQAGGLDLISLVYISSIMPLLSGRSEECLFGYKAANIGKIGKFSFAFLIPRGRRHKVVALGWHNLKWGGGKGIDAEP